MYLYMGVRERECVCEARREIKREKESEIEIIRTSF